MVGPEHGGQAEADPDGCRDDRDAGEHVAGLGAKRAGAAHAAQRAGQPAATATLHQDQQDQKNRQKR
jgi:hypothetical protein